MTGKIVCFGELLLRLGASGHQRLQSAQTLELYSAGAEANVAVGLAGFGQASQMVSVLSNNPLGDRIIVDLFGPWCGL